MMKNKVRKTNDSESEQEQSDAAIAFHSHFCFSLVATHSCDRTAMESTSAEEWLTMSLPTDEGEQDESIKVGYLPPPDSVQNIAKKWQKTRHDRLVDEMRRDTGLPALEARSAGRLAALEKAGGTASRGDDMVNNEASEHRWDQQQVFNALVKEESDGKAYFTVKIKPGTVVLFET